MFAAAVIVVLGLAGWTLAKEAQRPAPSGPAADRDDRTYSVYTSAFDVVCTGPELAALVATNAVDARSSAKAGAVNLSERRQQFAQSSNQVIECKINFGNTAICILLDQSGSMTERMPRIAGGLLAAMRELEAKGAATMAAGFTTVGWRGGRSRQQWIEQGRPAYPGRLCDLLHVVYSDFEHTTTATDFDPLLDQTVIFNDEWDAAQEPSVFFENIDGEAIAWAEQELLGASCEKRCLIVISDGAPVDDSTLHENGPSFLWWHLEEVVEAVKTKGAVALGAVGIDHRVDSVYPVSRMVRDGDGIAQAIIDVAEELIPISETGDADRQGNQ